MPRPVSYEVPDFNGCYHSLDGTTPDPSLLWFAENVWPTDPARPSSLRIRPGLVQGPYLLGTATARLLLSLPVAVSALGYDRLMMVVAGGEIYEATSATTWTKRITTADLAAASITVSSTTAIWGCRYQSTLVISDGTNTPFTWDGTAGGGLTKLTNAPAFFGPPTVYYGKIFAILASSQQSIVWSEENAANTGYTAGGYNNTWQLSQTSQHLLYAIAGSNEALYYFRSRGIGRITGAVTPDFTTTGTHDAISDAVGTIQPSGPLIAGSDVFFTDNTYRPFLIRSGTLTDLSGSLPAFITTSRPTVVPLPAYEATANSVISALRPYPSSVAVYGRPTVYGEFLFFWYANNDAVTSVSLVFHRPSLRFLGYFSWPGFFVDSFQNMEVCRPSWLAFANESAALCMLATSGNADSCPVGVFNIMNPVQTSGVSDQIGATNTPITARWITGKLGLSRDIQQFFETITVESWRDNTSCSAVTVQYLTSQAPTIASMGAAQAVTPAVRARESHTVGIQGYGRWITLVGTATLSGSSMVEWLGLKVTGFVDAPELAVV